MGACTSVPQQQPGASHAAPGWTASDAIACQKIDAAAEGHGASSKGGGGGSEGGCAAGPATPPVPSFTAGDAATAVDAARVSSVEMLAQVQELQNALALVSEAPGLGLAEAAELLQAELGVGLVSIYGFGGGGGDSSCSSGSRASSRRNSGDASSSGGGSGAALGNGTDGAVAVLMASFGVGAGILEAHAVVRDPAWSCLRLRAAGAASLQASVPRGGKGPAQAPQAGDAATSGDAAALPADWAMLHRQAGLCSFLAVPIGPAARPWGALAVADARPAALGGPRWGVYPKMAAVALLHQLRHWMAGAACDLLPRLEAAPDRISLIHELLKSAQEFMTRATNAPASVRLAAIDGACSRALIFEPRAQAAAPVAAPAGAPPAAPHAPPASGLVMSELPLPNTLLASAVAMRKARFVRDVTSYYQSSARPAGDVFTQPTQLVSSLVVVPLVYGEAPPGLALYVTLESPNNFVALQGPLLGFVNSVVPLLHHRLGADLPGVWAEAGSQVAHLRERQRRVSFMLNAASAASNSLGGGSLGGAAGGARGGLGAKWASDCGAAEGAGGGAGGRGPVCSPSAPLPSLGGAASAGTGGGSGHDSGAGNGAAFAAGMRFPSSCGAAASGSAACGDAGAGASGGGSGFDVVAAAAAAKAALEGPGSGQLVTSVNRRRLCTAAMVKAVEQEVLMCKRISLDNPPPPSPPPGASAGPRSGPPSGAFLQSACASESGAAGAGAAAEAAAALSAAAAGADMLAPPQAGELVLSDCVLGSGGFGAVWRGSWNKVTCAVKVMYARRSEQEAMADAVEMAVLSAVSHPHIVRAYECLTDMVQITGAGDSWVSEGNPACAWPSGGAATGGGAPRFRRMLPFEDPEEVQACNVIVMEYCDMGTLRQVLRRGLFHRLLCAASPPGPAPAAGAPPPLPLPAPHPRGPHGDGRRASGDGRRSSGEARRFSGDDSAWAAGGARGHGGGSGRGPVGVDLSAIVDVALEVAGALAYLHSIRLCHCDVKLDNVVLKTDVAQPRGYISKLCDFGLVKVLGASGAAVNVNGMGTVTHLAPELFVAGSRVTPAADVYAFGVLLYELYAGGRHAYAGMSKDDIILRVSHEGLRPRFPAGTPPAYADLAAACWAHDPAARPSMRAVAAGLQGVLREAEAAWQCGGA